MDDKRDNIFDENEENIKNEEHIEETSKKTEDEMKETSDRESMKETQRNWIGRSEGTEVVFKSLTPSKDENKEIEYLVAHEFKLSYLQEWWKQLFAESEGKNGKGLYVESAIFTRDLHSFGQMIQDGNKITFETIIEVEDLKNDIIIPYIDEDFDNLNYLAKKSLNDINRVAVTATRKAHTDGNVPTVRIKIPKLDAYNIGKLIYFFEMSCAISAYMLEVNPFDQPGVDNYKKNMYQLLEKM